MRYPSEDTDRSKRSSVKAQPKQAMSRKVAKRTLDIIGALLFFALFSGVYFLVWWLVLLTTGGPAIYRHKRVGRDGREFYCLKFRSMVVNSDDVLRELLEKNSVARAEWNTTFKLKEDPRITKFGRFIRKTSLDELPQFWNVLRGDMSIVGPRPVIRKELDDHYGIYAKTYIKVRPGITGPWQVGGRSDLTYTERVALDTEYVMHWTVLGDLKLIAKTVLVVFQQRGSY